MSENKCDTKCAAYAPSVLRLGLGLLFIIPGLQKLSNPEMIIGMLGGLGFPAPAFLGWILLLSEIAFGLAVLTGWRLQKTVWPLVLIAAIALFTVHFPAWFAKQPMALISVLFHILAITGLISLHFSGPGAMSVKSK
jgi:putative oxidoreductase